MLAVVNTKKKSHVNVVSLEISKYWHRVKSKFTAWHNVHIIVKNCNNSSAFGGYHPVPVNITSFFFVLVMSVADNLKFYVTILFIRYYFYLLIKHFGDKL